MKNMKSQILKALILLLVCMPAMLACTDENMDNNNSTLDTPAQDDPSQDDPSQDDPSQGDVLLLDFVFNADGTASDKSPNAMAVTTYPKKNQLVVSEDKDFEGYIASFNPSTMADPTWNGGYYEVNYSSDVEFQESLADGHSLEVLFRLGKHASDAKDGMQTRVLSSISTSSPYSGTCIAIEKDNAASNKSCISFEPYVGGKNLKVITDVIPLKDQYYHVVGVYDREQKKAYTYVNGVKCAEVDAEGEYLHSNLKTFVLGGNATTTAQKASNTFYGDIAIARIYDNPISADRAAELYNEVKPFVDAVADRDKIVLPAEGAVRLATYNVGIFSKELENATSMIASMMNELEVKVMALNELDSCNTRHNTYQLKEFAEAMGNWNYNHSRAIPYEGGAYGEGLVSHPSLPVLNNHDVPLAKAGGREARTLAVSEFQDFVFCSTHLDHVSADARLAQAKELTAWVEATYGTTDKPVFLAGDLNAVPTSDVITFLKEDWTILTPLDYTISAINPSKCIDYIMVYKNASSRVKSLGGKVVTKFTTGDVKVASDHLPVYADVVIE